MMRKLAVNLILALIALSAVAASRQTSIAQTDLSDEQIKSILRDRIDVAKKSVGIVVGLIDDKGSHIVAYGKPALDSTQSVNGDSVFEIGSVTKTFTATLLADMVERSELNLDDPISKFLPASVKAPTHDGKEITLRQLSSQVSGLPRMPSNFSPKDQSNPYADYSVEQMYAFISSYTLTRDPGAQYGYSNLGVGLLGHILALRSRMDYETLVRTRVLQPLKMNDTAIEFTPGMRARLATGHNQTLKPVANWDIPTLAGAGALRSTVNDMLKYVAANLGLTKTPLAAAMQKTHQPQHETGTADLEVGLGWHILKKFDAEIVWDNGGGRGNSPICGVCKKERRGRGFVILSNSTNDIDDIGRHLLVNQYPLAPR